MDWTITVLQNEYHVSFSLSNLFPFIPEMDLSAADCSSSKRECHRENSCQRPCKFGAATDGLKDWLILKRDSTLTGLSIVSVLISFSPLYERNKTDPIHLT